MPFRQLRHVFGVETKGAKPVFNLSPLLTSLDGPILAASSSFWAVPWVGGGGPVYVSPISAAGKVSPFLLYIAPFRFAVLPLSGVRESYCTLAPKLVRSFSFAEVYLRVRERSGLVCGFFAGEPHEH